MKDKSIAEMVNIIGLGHVEMLVSDLSRAQELYVDIFGFVLTERTEDAIYLRCIEDRCHHTLKLKHSSHVGIGNVSFRVAEEEDLDKMQHRFSSLDLPTRWIEKGEEIGQGRALQVQDPNGLPIEFFSEMDVVDWKLQEFHTHRGAVPMRIDHANALVTDADAGARWWMEELGFKCSEYTESDPPESRRWASWLYRKPTVHDIAIMTGKGPSLHHVGITVKNEMDTIRLCDNLASVGYADAIERGPQRHGISNAFFVYIRDHDGNRVEFYTSDYLTSDPDFKPIRWSLDDPRRQTLWGPPPPRRWFEESMAVESITDGTLMTMADPAMRSIPKYVMD
jgi:catechol 2,3-dioxygenase